MIDYGHGTLNILSKSINMMFCFAELLLPPLFFVSCYIEQFTERNGGWIYLKMEEILKQEVSKNITLEKILQKKKIIVPSQENSLC